MNFLRHKVKNREQAGDTMIEVLACIAVVGVALAGGYALSSHSLRTGIDASERSAALSIAQGQVEFLKNAVANKDPDVYTVNAPQAFCINDTNGVRTPSSNDPANFCNVHFSPYSIALTYDSDTKVFTIKPMWDSFSGSGRSEISLYYKLPESFPAAPTPAAAPGPPPPPIVAGCTTASYPDALSATNLASRSSGGTTSVSFTLSPPISVCAIATYVLTVVAGDESHLPGSQTDQTNERVFIEAYSSGDPVPVFVTGLTDDIPENQITTIPKDFTVSVAKTVNLLVIKHMSIHPNPTLAAQGDSSTNSIHQVWVRVRST